MEKRLSFATITPELISQVRDRIVERVHPDQIYLFGSAARGNTAEESDLDILVVMDLPGDTNRRQLVAEIRELFQGWMVPMDILILTPAEFREGVHLYGHIARIAREEGELLYDR